jgi:hypothetical protein
VERSAPSTCRIDAYVIRWARRKFKRMRHQTKGWRKRPPRGRQIAPVQFVTFIFAPALLVRAII